jgi:hypothetical protein
MYLPGAVNFDGVRHFLELFPALAILAGWAVGRALGRHRAALSRRRGLVPLVVAALVAPSAWAVARIHPHQIAYWNALGGGLEGARSRGEAQAGDYWGMSYRQGIDWLNQHAPPGSVIAVPVIEHAVALVAPLRLRPDLGLAHTTLPVRPELLAGRLERLRALGRERPLFVMFVVREDWSNELIRECRRRLRPEMSLEVEGVPILEIYRFPGEIYRADG